MKTSNSSNARKVHSVASQSAKRKEIVENDLFCRKKEIKFINKTRTKKPKKKKPFSSR